MKIIVAKDEPDDFIAQLASGADKLLTPAQVSTIFACDPKTVTRWAKEGKIASIRTLGGHRRYSWTEVQRLLAQGRSD
jgi:excisionase family DNA binding protein